eukprot:gene6243-272_t
MSLKSDFFPMNVEAEDEEMLHRNDSLRRKLGLHSDLVNPNDVEYQRRRKYLIYGISAFAFVLLVGGLAIGLSAKDAPKEDVPPFAAFSMSPSSLCGVENREDGTAPVKCFKMHTNTPVGSFQSVSHSSTHACAISVSSVAICWGEACDSDRSSCPSHLRTATQIKYSFVAVGETTTCLIRSDDNGAECYGAMPIPSSLQTKDFSSIHVLDNTVCGLTGTSQIVCWGNDGDVFEVPILDSGVRDFSVSEEVVPLITSQRRRVIEPVYDPEATSTRVVCASSFAGGLYCTHTANANVAATRPWTEMNIGQSSVQKVSIFRGRGCALTTYGQIRCFKLGDHVSELVETPPGFNALNFTHINLMSDVACALTNNRVLHCWGQSWRLGLLRFPSLTDDVSQPSAAIDTGTAHTVNATSETEQTLLVGFTQPCPDGTRRKPDGSCEDIDECRANTLICPRWSYCVNTYASAECHCFPGFEKEEATGLCLDIDECLDGTHECNENATCVNWVGRYWCRCNRGYEGDGFECADIDECDLEIDNCHPSLADCTNTFGSFQCDCINGYEGDGVDCTDIDECATNTDSCHELANCTNTIGSYTCECVGLSDGDGFFCDPDQCALETDSCHQGRSICEDKVPGYNCSCIDGYEGDGHTCDDIDECARDLDNCHENADCTNTIGSFTCACSTHYVGDGFECDLDECSAGVDTCHAEATCTNAIPGYSCECNTGWAGTGHECEDVDECEENTYSCRPDSHCENTIGSYICPCNDFFREVGSDCIDINECDENRYICPDGSSCTNTHGFFECDCNDLQHYALPLTPEHLHRTIFLTRSTGNPVLVLILRDRDEASSIDHFRARIIWCPDTECALPTNEVYNSPDKFQEAPSAAIRQDSVIILAGRPVNSQVLRYRYCADVQCTQTGTRNIAEAGTGTQVAVDSDDNIVIVSSSSTTLRVVHCYSYECEWANREVNSTSELATQHLAMVLQLDGRPVVTFLESSGFGVFTCSDQYCSSFLSSDYSGAAGFDSSIAMRSDGRAVVAWRDQDAGELKFGLCSDVDCSHLEVTTVSEGGSSVGMILRRRDWIYTEDHATIVHLNVNHPNKHVELIECRNQACTEIEKSTLQNHGHSTSVSVYYDPISHYLFTADGPRASGDGWRLSRHCFGH